MVLGCFMCRRPLLPILEPQKTSKSNKYALSLFGKGVNSLSARSRERELGKSLRPMGSNLSNTKEKEFEKDNPTLFQPMTTKCGHIFHRGCLKEFSLQLSNRPAAPGNPVVCPICSKGFVYSHCINVYLDAVPDPVKDRSDKYIRLLDLQEENAEIKQNITFQRDEIEINNKRLKEINEKIQAVGREILTKGDDLTQFKKYTKRVGSIDGLVERLSNSRENYKSLRAQNAKLYQFVKNQRSVKHGTQLDSELIAQLSSLKKYTVPDDLLDEFEEGELFDDVNIFNSEPSVQQMDHSSSDEEINQLMLRLPEHIPPPKPGLKLKASDIANQNYETYKNDDVEDFDSRKNIDKTIIQLWNYQHKLHSQLQAPSNSKPSSKTKYLLNQEQRQTKLTSNHSTGVQVHEMKSNKSKKSGSKVKDVPIPKINNNISKINYNNTRNTKIKPRKTNYELNYAGEFPSLEDEVTILLDPQLDQNQMQNWEDERVEGAFSAKDYECLRLK